MKVGCQSSPSTTASNRPNCSSGSFQWAGAGAVQGGEAGAQLPGIAGLGITQAGVPDERFAHRHAGELRIEIDLAAGVGQGRGAGRLTRRVPQDLFGEIHQVVVVPVGGIELHHGEFGVVPHRDASLRKLRLISNTRSKPPTMSRFR